MQQESAVLALHAGKTGADLHSCYSSRWILIKNAPIPPQMQDIFREMGATYSLLYPEQSGLRTPSSTSVLAARAVVYLQTHYQNPTLTTAQLAQELYASREHLSRAFKECTMESTTTT